MDPIKLEFPIVEAILTLPELGQDGNIAICTNTSAPGQILNDVPEEMRKNICVLGTLIVSRDGGERMIINSLSHPTLKYLILFSEESLTFAPATNLLQALMHGFDKSQSGNYISGGIAASAHYPNINENIFNLFKKEIIVIPAFMHKQPGSAGIVTEYLEWLKPKIDLSLHTLLTEISAKDKIYFDSLKKILQKITELPKVAKQVIELDPKDFQHLSPPKIELPEIEVKYSTPFKIGREGKNIRLDLNLGGESVYMSGSEPFLLEYSLMRYLGENKKLLSPLEQIILGAELGRVESEILNEIKFDKFISENSVTGTKQLSLEPKVTLVQDKKYYYKVNTRGNRISVMCLAFDVCESVFELLSPTLPSMVERLTQENRFEDYEMDILHRMDIGTQLARSAIAASGGYAFIQDFSAIFKINRETLPSTIVEGDSFLDVHKSVLRKLYTKGITEEHGDSWKGLARSGSVLAVYRKSEEALKDMPAIYRQGDQDAATVRSKYKKELLRKDHDGTYTYGERTRSYFGFDQLEETIKVLRKDPTRAAVVQRFDPVEDMTAYTEEGSGKRKFTHDPCLTHDIFFIQNGKLNAFHIARAHNAVNAYPENVFGLFDAYTTNIANNLKGIEIGDMYMLSNRANILLLTEEQRTKKILGEPSKPVGEVDTTSGPYQLDPNTKLPDAKVTGGIAYYFGDMQKIEQTNHPTLTRLQNYRGINTLQKAIDYLKEKGGMHNNPVLTEYFAGENNPQGDQLAFFQANVFGNKVYATAVFMNRSISNLEKDKELINYLGTQFALGLGTKFGTINIYYVAYTS